MRSFKGYAKHSIDQGNIKGANTNRKQKVAGSDVVIHRQRDSEDPLRPIEGRQLPVECLETVLVGELVPVKTYSPSTYVAPVEKVVRCLRRAYFCSRRYSSSSVVC